MDEEDAGVLPGAGCSRYDGRGASSSPIAVPASQSPSPQSAQNHDVADAFWEYFNPLTEIDVRTGGSLPLEQGPVWYFVTFRLADSLPRAVIEEIKQQREQWKQAHDLENLSRGELAEYHRLFSEKYERLLDAGSGSCALREPRHAQIVRSALNFFQGRRYVLDESVVMPNHVHVLVKPLANHRFVEILHSWRAALHRHPIVTQFTGLSHYTHETVTSEL